MRLQCPSCDSYNEPEALHCNQCGAAISLGAGTSGGGPGRSRRWLPWALPLGIAGWLVGPSIFQAPDPVDEPIDRDEVEPQKPEARFRSPESDPDPALVDLVEPREVLGVDSNDRAQWGWLEVEDPAQISLNILATAISAEGWTALPRKSLLGADRVVFRKGRAGEGELTGGLFRIGDPMGLWKFDPTPGQYSLPLHSYDPDLPATILRPGEEGRRWEPASGLSVVGSFFHVDEPVNAPGVISQDGYLVGWLVSDEAESSSDSGGGISGVWLWNGPPGEDLAIQATLLDFQRSEFNGGVVDGYRSIFSPQLDDLTALGALDVARIRAPRLLTHEIPSPYSREALLQEIRERLSKGLGNDPQSYFWGLSAESLRWLQDPLTARIWLTLALESRDTTCISEAISTMEGISFTEASPGALAKLEELLPSLWIAGVESLRTAGEVDLAERWISQGRQNHPTDDTLRLLDGERLLDLGRLNLAEEALRQPVVDANLRVIREQLIERLRLERSVEGRILVRFTPGSPVIEATAQVGSVPVRFLIDTGASATSIPASVVQQLGITIDDRTLQRRIRTASDEFMAPVVDLPVINLEGAIVSGIQATVLDLPGQPGVGLLGLDFLSNFRLDIDVERGWLLLEPR